MKLLNSLNKTTSPKVFGIGLLSLDLVFRHDNEKPIHWSTGGTCGNVLTILAYLGWDAFPIARLNGDQATQFIKKDLENWKVNLDFISIKPLADAPIIIQKIVQKKDGQSRHYFSWDCPNCGTWLPSYKAVLNNSTEDLLDNLSQSKVFFFDRVSRSAITLAKQAAATGSLVIFEPSQKGDKKLLEEALNICHILKYSDQRFPDLFNAVTNSDNTILEIQTCGQGGFKYRSKLSNAKTRSWKAIKSLKINNVVDTAGAGDWFTGGLISLLGNKTIKQLNTISKEQLEAIFHVCQAMSVWNCFYEGARGGMYAVQKNNFLSHIKKIMEGQEIDFKQEKNKNKIKFKNSICSACP